MDAGSIKALWNAAIESDCAVALWRLPQSDKIRLVADADPVQEFLPVADLGGT